MTEIIPLLFAIKKFVLKNDCHGFKAFLSQKDSGDVCLYLMTNAETYDFELSEKLYEFAASYISQKVLDAVMLIPASSPEELQVFFDTDSAISIDIS